LARAGAAEPTEAPSARRIREARRRGLVAHSRDLSAALALVALFVVLSTGAARGFAELEGLVRAVLSASPRDAAARAVLAARALDVAAALTLLPLAPVLVVGVVASVLQTGGLVTWSAAAPDLGRLSFRGSLARLASARVLGAVARALGKTTFIAVVLGVALVPLLRRLPALAGVEPRAVVRLFGVGARTVGMAAATSAVAWGLVDWMLARRRHRLSLMMTRPEALRERRETEGDGHQKAERLRRHREIGAAAPASATAVPGQDELRGADFVVTDGAGLTIAVRYDRAALRAPIVVVAAGGQASWAVPLERLAHEARVPVHVDAALAQALASVPEGAEIPEATFAAVAELLRESRGAASERSRTGA
jgi:type III secretion protein U